MPWTVLKWLEGVTTKKLVFGVGIVIVLLLVWMTSAIWVPCEPLTCAELAEQGKWGGYLEDGCGGIIDCPEIQCPDGHEMTGYKVVQVPCVADYLDGEDRNPEHFECYQLWACGVDKDSACFLTYAETCNDGDKCLTKVLLLGEPEPTADQFFAEGSNCWDENGTGPNWIEAAGGRQTFVGHPCKCE